MNSARAGGVREKDLLLVSMPWRLPDCPNLALGLLKPLIQAGGMSCTIYEVGLEVSLEVPSDLYSALGSHPAGEIAFAPFAYPGYPESKARGLLRESFECSDWDPGAAVDAAGNALHQAMRHIEPGRHGAIGFSLTFQQTLASMALARMLKDREPGLRILIGGAACDGPMGAALLQEFPHIDMALSGRAEAVIVEVARVALGARSERAIPGLFERGKDGRVAGAEAVVPSAALDELPIPDFDDYFDSRRALGLPPHGARLLLETSVGCWWGERHLCKFCGLNSHDARYRQKQGPRVLAELLELSKRYEVTTFELTDNALPLSVLQDLAPSLAESDSKFSFFADVRSNLTKQGLASLSRAGFTTLQPGIESFSDHVLKLMGKGVHALDQVQFLKWCAELGINLAYSILTGSPGEVAGDYELMASWVPRLLHLPPPFSEPVPIQIARFSPYFASPVLRAHGRLEPLPVYSLVFPLAPDERLRRMVPSFTLTPLVPDAPELDAARASLTREVGVWRRAHRKELLTYRGGSKWVRITDGRSAAANGGGNIRRVVLRDHWAAAYRYCDQHRSLENIAAQLPQVSSIELDAFLAQMVRQGLMLTDGRRYLALAIDATTISSKEPPIYKRVTDDRSLWAEFLSGQTWIDDRFGPAHAVRSD